MTVATGHNAHTSITFMRPDSKYNRRYVIPGKEVNTGKYEQQNVYVKDARPKKTEFSLEKQGFVLNEHTSTVSN
jgi:hypothetical protein